MSTAVNPVWRVERQEHEALLTLSRDWLVCDSGLRSHSELSALLGEIDGCTHIRFAAGGLARWDSALVTFIWSLQSSAQSREYTIELDLSSLPEALRQLPLKIARERLCSEMAVRVA